MNEHAKNLRRTRADMLGTDDEEHYWECHAAADEIERLEGDRDHHWKISMDLSDKIERLRAALRRIANTKMEAWGDEFQEGLNCQADKAIAALETDQ